MLGGPVCVRLGGRSPSPRAALRVHRALEGETPGSRQKAELCCPHFELDEAQQQI